MGHAAASVLNGGLHAWANEGHPLTADPVPREPSSYPLSYGDDALASKSELLALLGDPSLGLLDARTPEEFAGTKVRAARGGRIPGAANLNWLDTMDRGRNLRLLPDEQLRTLLRARGLTPEKLIVSYCHTHHRSAHSYVMLKHLGYDRIKAYAGSWSEWGNDPATPVEQG